MSRTEKVLDVKPMKDRPGYAEVIRGYRGTLGGYKRRITIDPIRTANAEWAADAGIVARP